MLRQQQCDRSLTTRFLADQLNDSEQLAFEEHLESCPQCREELATVAAERELWDEVRETLCSRRSMISSSGSSPSSSGDDDINSSCDAVLAMLNPTDDPHMLGRFGGYEIAGIVGRGGMGVVLKGFDAALNRFVAIKVLAPHLATSGAARKRFSREAQAAAAVVHDNVIAIHSVSEERGHPYVVMPYERGPSLQKRVDDCGPLAVVEVLRIGMQAARGLAAAHAQGIVHRDVKPANILLSNGTERVKLTDFGLARAADDASLTRTGVIAGTPQYMSPEQARGESVDQRSDLFSLGSVVYALCTGRPPFRAETSYGILRRITDTEPRPIREVNPDIPAWLCAIIAKLMAKQAEDRFASAAEVAELLEDSLAHVQQPTTVSLPERVEQLSQSSVGELAKSSGFAASPKVLATFATKRGWPSLIGLAAFAFALVFAGILIVLELGKGTLSIESDADDVPIKIMQGDEVVRELTVSRDGASVRVAAGKYVVEIDAGIDGIVVQDGTIILKRGGAETVRIVSSKDEPRKTEGDRKNESRAWQQSEPYIGPSFANFFPDDADGGIALDKLWNAADKDSRTDQEILQTVRRGLRRTREHRTLVLGWLGNKYIWNKSPQHPDAIEIMYHAADFSGERADPYGTRHYAVYFGLSVVQPKSPAILRTLAELGMRVDDPNDLDRIAWGASNQKQELLEYLKPFHAADDEAVRRKAAVCERIFSGELKAFAWAAEQARLRALENYADQLPQFKEVLQSGSTEDRRKTLDTILGQRLSLIMDDSFLAAFAKCAEDSDPGVRDQTAIIAGGKWIWEAENQRPDAIKLMLRLSEDADRQVRYDAVYYGLSTVRNKSDAVVRRLLEMAFADRGHNLFRRIEWGLRDDRERAAKLLEEYIEGSNQQHAAAAREIFRKIIGRDPSGPGGESAPTTVDNRQHREHLRKEWARLLGTWRLEEAAGDAQPDTITFRDLGVLWVRFTDHEGIVREGTAHLGSGRLASRISIDVPNGQDFRAKWHGTYEVEGERLKLNLDTLDIVGEDKDTTQAVQLKRVYKRIAQENPETFIPGGVPENLSDRDRLHGVWQCIATGDTDQFGDEGTLFVFRNMGDRTNFSLVDDGQEVGQGVCIVNEKEPFTEIDLVPMHGADNNKNLFGILKFDGHNSLTIRYGQRRPKSFADSGEGRDKSVIATLRRIGTDISLLKSYRPGLSGDTASNAENGKVPGTVGSSAGENSNAAIDFRLAWSEPAEGLIELVLAGGEQKLYLKNEPIATSVDVASARVIDDANSKPAIEVSFKEEAAQRLGEATARHVGHPLAILVDGKLLSAPKLQERIGPRAIITGDFTRQEAEEIAQSINVAGKSKVPGADSSSSNAPVLGTDRAVGTPLLDAIREFNRRNQDDEIGKNQPPLTDDEVIASIRDMKYHRDEIELSDEDYLAFQRSAETGVLPPGWSLNALSEIPFADGGKVDVWTVVLTYTKPRGNTPEPRFPRDFTHVIRQRALTYHPKQMDVPDFESATKPPADRVSLFKLVSDFTHQWLSATSEETPESRAYPGIGPSITVPTEPPVTVDEIVAAIQLELHQPAARKRRADAAFRKELERIIETNCVPQGTKLDNNMGYSGPDFEVDIRGCYLKIPSTEEGVVAWAVGIRSQFIRSTRIEKTRDDEIAWGPPAADGLQVGIQLARIEGGNLPHVTYAPKFYFRNRTGKTVAALEHVIDFFDVDARTPTGERLPVKTRLSTVRNSAPIFPVEVTDDERIEKPGLPILIGGFTKKHFEEADLLKLRSPPDQDAPVAVVNAQIGEPIRLRFHLPHPANFEGPRLISGEIRLIVGEKACAS